MKCMTFFDIKRKLFLIILSLFCFCYFFSWPSYASKYYYENYEPSEVYAVAEDNSSSKNSTTKSTTKTLSTLNNNNEDQVIRNTIIVRTQRSNDKNNNETRVETQKVDTTPINYIQENQKIRERTKPKESFKYKRISPFLIAGYNMGVAPTINISNGGNGYDFINSNDYKSPTTDVWKIVHGFNTQFGLKFYISSSGTGFFIAPEMYYTFLRGSANYTWQSSLSYTYPYQNDQNDATYKPKTDIDHFDSLMDIDLKHIVGLSLKLGYSISRLSAYGKANIGWTKLEALWKMTDDSVNTIWDGSDTIPASRSDYPGHAKASAYYAMRNLAKNGEVFNKWIFTYGCGVGIEIAFSQNVFLQLEYNHYWLKDTKINFTQKAYTYADAGNKNGTVGYTDTAGNTSKTIKTNFGTFTASLGINF